MRASRKCSAAGQYTAPYNCLGNLGPYDLGFWSSQSPRRFLQPGWSEWSWWRCADAWRDSVVCSVPADKSKLAKQAIHAIHSVHRHGPQRIAPCLSHYISSDIISIQPNLGQNSNFQCMVCFWLAESTYRRCFGKDVEPDSSWKRAKCAAWQWMWWAADFATLVLHAGDQPSRACLSIVHFSSMFIFLACSFF